MTTAGRLYSVPGLVTATEYNAAGQVTRIDYANSVRTDNSFDAARGWMMSTVTSRLGVTLDARQQPDLHLQQRRQHHHQLRRRDVHLPCRRPARPHAALTAGGNTYTYDAVGNMLTGAGRTLTWDGLTASPRCSSIGSGDQRDYSDHKGWQC